MRINSAFLWQTVSDIFQSKKEITNPFDGEMLLTVSEDQVNDAIAKFVVKNVKAILDMKIELHDDWFRLYCTIHTNGIYTQVASNFELVQIQLDRNHQRLVFAQQGHTDVLSLHAVSYWQKKLIGYVISFFHKVLKKDPLGLILEAINLAIVKENVFYIDIGRWLRKNEKIMTTLYKTQVNTADCAEKHLLLKGHINYADLFANNIEGELITDKDNPNKSDNTDVTEKADEKSEKQEQQTETTAA